ncbi:MAG TPA: hypothetical protein VKV73_04740 [Chloroflexota bacterium]|nr:hypothetical protein [Chloroflexota bacterium]
MQPPAYGIEGIVDADRAYQGSRFAEVRDAVFSQPYPGTRAASGRMPTYPVMLGRMVHGLLQFPFGRFYAFRQATARAVDSHADLRWGPDGRGFRRLVHPNAICLSGVWEITEPTAYSGYFASGSKALVIGRYSTCCTETRRGHTRSLALAGKLFPTTDPEHAAPLRTASFFTQQDIGGDDTDYINDVELRNAPDTSSWRRGSGMPILLITGLVFSFVDREPTIRQLYDVAELGKPDAEPTRAPAYMRLLVAPEQPRIEGPGLDFRDEIMRQIVDSGRLVFTIEVTDDGETHGPASAQRRRFSNWRRIGTLTFDDAAASYNGDFVLHFHHPTWRRDRNDPATATRVGERKRA